MIIKGKVWKFGADIDTDELFAGRHLMGGDETNAEAYQEFISGSGLSQARNRSNVPDGFLENVRRGDIIVAEENFGIGSSRQQAAETLKFKGIAAVVADSVHRIFFRNFWNLGCPALDVPGISKGFSTGQEIQIDFGSAKIRNCTTGEQFDYHLCVPPWFMNMLKAGGLIPYHRSMNR